MAMASAIVSLSTGCFILRDWAGMIVPPRRVNAGKLPWFLRVAPPDPSRGHRTKNKQIRSTVLSHGDARQPSVEADSDRDGLCRAGGSTGGVWNRRRGLSL